MTQSPPVSATLINENPKTGVSTRLMGLITVHEHQISFLNDKQNMLVPIQGSHVSLGGAGKRYAYITHPSHPTITIETDQLHFFKRKTFRNHDAYRRFAGQRRGHHALLWSGIGLVTVILCLIGYALFFGRAQITENIVAHIPKSYDQVIGTKIAEFEGFEDQAVQDPEITEMFNAMVEPLIAAAPEYEWRFYIMPDETVNAAALPGGVILIHTGLIDFTENAEELLGVVAHEMVHVQNRHAMKALVYQLGWTLLRLSTGVQDQMIIDMILRQGNHLSKLSYSRYHEYEADREAMALLQKAGIDARGFPTFFLRLKERYLEKGQRQIPITLFDTHPMPQERAEALHKVLQDMPRDPRRSTINYDLFKKQVLSAAASQDPKPSFMEASE